MSQSSRAANAPERGGFTMMGAFARAYPTRSVIALVSVFIAGLLDGLGMTMLLSMLAMATDQVSKTPSGPQKVALKVAEFLHVAPTAANMLILATTLIVFKAVLALLANRQVGHAVARIATDLRLSLIRAAMQSRWSHYLQLSVGRLSNAIATEAQRASESFQYAAEMAATLLNAVIYLGIAMAISWKAGLVIGVAGAVLVLLLQTLIRSSRRAGQRQTVLLKSMLITITGQLTAVKPLKAMAREDHVDALLSDQTRQLKGALKRQVESKEALAALQEPLLAILVGIGFYFSLTVLKMPLSEVLVMLFMLARTVAYLSKAQKAYQQVVVRESAYWSIVDDIEAAQSAREPIGGSVQSELSSAIRFDNVSFTHGGQRTVLKDASFVIPAYELSVIIGPSGAGKTTLLDLVAGLQHAESGKILIDGESLETLDLRHWRRQIGYVAQESVMVDESVAYNLTLGEDISEAEIREALRAADALSFVESMAEGLQSRVGEGGSRLSGGQRQRLAIARALLHKPRLLILDEATSALDPEAQAAIIETVCHLKGKLTILAVAHQDRLIKAADRIFRLSNGHISLPETVGNVSAHG